MKTENSEHSVDILIIDWVPESNEDKKRRYSKYHNREDK